MKDSDKVSNGRLLTETSTRFGEGLRKYSIECTISFPKDTCWFILSLFPSWVLSERIVLDFRKLTSLQELNEDI
jgi:hypothetical protein